MAGRPPGTPKTGGRAKGVPNKATAAKAAEIAATGLTPLDYLTSVYRDETVERAARVDAAKAAAPYVHPRLTNMDANVTGNVVVGVATYPGIDGDG